ncbi:CPBP family intramembrane glutamic endopeptidase [Planctomicrobium sp. SH668]|uniref:CPBP family intramembrane glutamic endopeptidase n=1 Tax=Planctomicrobium sp. SH668 TaxID=3448126 RepID=UPI003F5C6F54
MNFQDRNRFLTTSTTMMAVFAAIALLFAWMLNVPIGATIHVTPQAIGVGIIAAVIMILTLGRISALRDEAERILGSVVASCRWYELAVLSVIVGIVEEIIFRGVMEQYGARYSPVAAFVIVNIIFGAMHAVSWTYAVIATLLGMILSGLAYWPGEYNLMRPIVAHAVYDFIAFLIIARQHRQSAMAPELGREEEHPNSDGSSL